MCIQLTEHILFIFRLLGTATVPLKDLVKDSSHTMQADVNLLDGNNRMTQVCELVLIIIIDLFNSKCVLKIFFMNTNLILCNFR